MKKNLLLTVSYIICAFLLNSCAEHKKTSLEFTVINQWNNPVQNAAIRLYTTENDWLNDTNQEGLTQYTNASGKVIFSEVLLNKYYWRVGMNCYNNHNGASTTEGNLTPNDHNQIEVMIVGTGTMIYKNNSSALWMNVTVDDDSFDVPYGEEKYLNNYPEKEYCITVKIDNGVEMSSLEHLSCGAIYTFTLDDYGTTSETIIQCYEDI